MSDDRYYSVLQAMAIEMKRKAAAAAQMKGWQDANYRQQLVAVLVQLKNMKAKTLTMNLSADSREEVLADGVEPFARRLSVRLLHRLGGVPEFVLGVDTSDGEIHLNGAIEISPRSDNEIRSALKEAADGKDGGKGCVYWYRLAGLDSPKLWANHMVRNFDILRHVGGWLLFSTPRVRRLAATEWESKRKQVVGVDVAA